MKEDERILTCVVCGNSLPSSEFYQTSIKGVFVNACKKCVWKIAFPKKGCVSREERIARRANRGEAHCNQCNQWLPVDKFARDKNRAFGIEYTCKKCRAEMQKERQARVRRYARARLSEHFEETFPTSPSVG